jgi:hypothetical protein
MTIHCTTPKTIAALAFASILMSGQLLAQDPAAATATAPRIDNPNCPEIVGKHALLEKMTESFGLTCKQEDIIEPLLHDEESVTKPLLAFTTFTPEERQSVMLKIKLAARAQIRPHLTPEQQTKSDAEAAATAASSAGGGKGGKTVKATDAFQAEENLCDAIAKYSAFAPEMKKELTLQVKQAARRPGAPELTADQAAKIDADIKKLS